MGELNIESLVREAEAELSIEGLASGRESPDMSMVVVALTDLYDRLKAQADTITELRADLKAMKKNLDSTSTQLAANMRFGQ